MPTPPSLSELQHAFGDVIAGGDGALLQPWIASRGIDAAARLRIYRNANYAIHVDALAVSYPAVRAFLGEACFDGLATRHAAWRGSRSGNLQDYGADFAAFLLEQDELAECTWLGEVARLEWQRQQVALAAAAPLADRDALLRTIAASDGDLNLRLLPHVRVIACTVPALDLWNYAQQPDAEEAPDPGAGPQQVLLWRDSGQVAMRGLHRAQFDFVASLLDGGDLTSALAATSACAATISPEDLLRPLLEHALIGAASPVLPIEDPVS